MQIRIPMCKYANVHVGLCKNANVQKCQCARMPMCKNANEQNAIQVYKYVQVWARDLWRSALFPLKKYPQIQLNNIDLHWLISMYLIFWAIFSLTNIVGEKKVTLLTCRQWAKSSVYHLLPVVDTKCMQCADCVIECWLYSSLFSIHFFPTTKIT